LEFTQYKFLKEYVEMNKKSSKEDDGELRMFFFKLMKNAVFEKTMVYLRGTL
jgi:uncharacterized protein YrzB (UPF0473 family)